MSEKKLFKFISRPLKHPKGTRYLQPIIISDSKAIYLYSEIATHYERSIKWYFRRGTTIKDGRKLIEQNIDYFVHKFGNISLNVWFGTCNLTYKTTKGRIALNTFNRKEAVESIIREIEIIIRIFRRYPNSEVTFLETPLYSIVEWNKHKRHPDITQFYEQDIELEEQVVELNRQIQSINTRLGRYSPKFSSDLSLTSKYKKGSHHQKSAKRHHHNFHLYKDGIHPDRLLSVVWLLKLHEQILKDCWH